MQRRNLIILGVAVIVGLFAVYLLNAYFSGIETRQERATEEGSGTRIVVASQDLEFGMPLTPGNVRLVNWPASSVPAGAFKTIDAALQDGRVALRPILRGEPILVERVSGKDGRASISYDIPEGMRAVSIPVGAVTSVSGFVRPGDIVDVLLTRPAPGGGEVLMTDVLLPNVQVLAIDQTANIKSTDPKIGKTAVLLVDLAGAQVLTLARDVGTMSLVLRNIEYADRFDDPRFAGARPYVTTRDINRNRPYFGGGPVRRAEASAPSVPTPVSATVAQRSNAGPPPPSGPSMTIVRGTEATQYQVSKYGRW